MKGKKDIFEQTYNNYLDMIRSIDLESIPDKLGAKYEENKIRVKLFNREYIVSSRKIIDNFGKRPSFDICVILSKYILLCPEETPNDQKWVSYRNLKDSAPLHHYFKNEVENAISSQFSGQSTSLQEAGELLGGYLPRINANYDIAMQFDALPKIPVMLLYNDSDEEFPATCSILFESQCEKYLDCECIAMLGRQLYTKLTNV